MVEVVAGNHLKGDKLIIDIVQKQYVAKHNF